MPAFEVTTVDYADAIPNESDDPLRPTHEVHHRLDIIEAATAEAAIAFIRAARPKETADREVSAREHR
ncbi:MAG: hypothetical protein U0R70_08855 [Solirubrobacteraceae bacterium]